MKQLYSLVMLAALFACACRKSDLPKTDSKAYADLCSAFYLGLAGLQSGEDVRAKEYLQKATVIAPGEPAGWADLGILQVRQQQFDAAYQSVDKAQALAPTNSRIEALLGLIESRRGKEPEAVDHLKKAVALDGHNVRALYALAEETERQQGPDNDRAAQSLLKQILEQQPANAAVLLDYLRLAAKRGDTAEARWAFSALQPLAGGWPAAAQQQVATVQQIVNGLNVRAAAVQVQFLRNVLLRVPSYREGLDQIRIPATLVAQPFVRFLRLPSPSSEAAASDAQMRFTKAAAANLPASGVSWLTYLPLEDQGAAVAVWAGAGAIHVGAAATVQLPLPGVTDGKTPLAEHAIAAADLNYDFKADIIAATSSGLKIYQQDDLQHFHDITASAKIPADLILGSYTGVWAYDVDIDGDLDLILGTPQGDPVVLRNNGDGSFTRIHTFAGVDGMASFATGDLDGDGDADVAIVDRNGAVHLFVNERLGEYRTRTLPGAIAQGVRAITITDLNGDGTLDLVALKQDGAVVRVSESGDRSGWTSENVAHASVSGTPRLLAADLDNNGAMDLIVNDQVFLNDGRSLMALPARMHGVAAGVADLNADGLLDVVGLEGDGSPVSLLNQGTKKYHWQVIRTRAAHATGDQRINSFGIGGEIEVRSDLLAQKQIISSPVLHFGLGEHTSVQFARIVWPNGFVQAEFDLKADQTLLAEQRIKGSCPMLFSWNGKEMEFLKDVGPWGSALGLNVNAQGEGIYGTREWFNVRGTQLAPHDGYLDLRITAEYWETYYMDHYSLLAVDHPAGTEVWTDERFAIPSPTPALVATGATRPFARATADSGEDVTATVRDLDNHFVDTFGRAQYQGLTRDHWIELELPADAPKNGPLYVIGQGWIHDTDSTIVKAQAQNRFAHPQGLSIEVPDGSGKWLVAQQGLGFPKGRVKTVVLDISNVFRAGAPRKLRLRTNLELFWNKLEWAPGLPLDATAKVQHLGLSSAELRFRGFSLITKADASSPELPHYDDIHNGDLRWHDQEGYVTRYGDVVPLLANVDDRYVITSPGDELRMRFLAPTGPTAGWKRDYILICDGWVKDADYNSTFAGTVLPLPYHGMKEYTKAPTTLEEDRAYQLHPDDWIVYQTRYVSGEQFRAALWSKR